MNLPLSTIQNTFSDQKYAIPKVAKNVLYICLESGCGNQVVSALEAEYIMGRYTGSKLCSECGVALWKVIK